MQSTQSTPSADTRNNNAIHSSDYSLISDSLQALAQEQAQAQAQAQTSARAATPALRQADPLGTTATAAATATPTSPAPAPALPPLPRMPTGLQHSQGDTVATAPARYHAAPGMDLPRAMPQTGAVDAVPAQPMPAWPPWQAPARTQPVHQAADAAAETAPSATVAAPAPAAQAADGAALPTPRPDLAPGEAAIAKANTNANEAAPTPAPAAAPAVRQADGDQTGPAATAAVTQGTATQQGPAGRTALAQSDPASQPGTTTVQETAQHATVTSGADAAVVQYSRSPDTKAAYESRIDALFAGEKPAMRGVRVLDRSDMITFLGLGDGPVFLAEGKVVEGQNNHPHMTAGVWKKIPEWMDNPALVFESETEPGRLVFFAPETVNGAPVRIIVQPNAAGGVRAHLLINGYDTPRGNPFHRWERDGLLRYVDRNKYASVSGTFQPRLAGLPGEQRRGKILTDKQYNGWRAKNNPAYSKETSSDAAATRPQPVATIQSVQAALNTLVGPKGRLRLGRGGVVVTTSERIQPDWEPLVGKVDIGAQGTGRVQGFYDPDSKTVFLIADHIQAGHEVAVAAHELMHKHGKAVLGEARWKHLHETLGTWAHKPQGSLERQVHDEALRRMEAARPADVQADAQADAQAEAQESHDSEELFPYAVEVAVEMGVQPVAMRPLASVAGWLARVRASLQATLNKLTNNPQAFDGQDLVDLAFGIAQRERAGAATGQWQGDVAWAKGGSASPSASSPSSSSSSPRRPFQMSSDPGKDGAGAASEKGPVGSENNPRPVPLTDLKVRIFSQYDPNNDIAMLVDGEYVGFANIDDTDDGPSLSIAKVAKIESTGEFVRIDAPGVTEAMLRTLISYYVETRGEPPVGLPGKLADSNLRNFQKEFDKHRESNQNGTADDWAQAAIRDISFGKARHKVGYGIFEITLKDPVGVDGFKNVPSKVNIIARMNGR